MNFVNEMEQGKSIDLPSPGCCPADVDTSSGSLFAEEDGATGEGLEVTEMPNFNSWDIGNRIQLFHSEPSVSGRKRSVNWITSVRKR